MTNPPATNKRMSTTDSTPAAAEKSIITVALVGNPNTGKSTLFTALAGIRQHIGNYPGATVEKKTGTMCFAGRHYELIDLPGLYSLAPRSRDEMVAVDLLLGRRQDSPAVDAVICIVDAANLARNLYLVSQVLELGRPTILAVNMLDVMETKGIKLDLQILEQRLGIPVIGLQANRRIGVPELKVALARVMSEKTRTDPIFAATKMGLSPLVQSRETVFPEVFEREAASLLEKYGYIAAPHETAAPLSMFLARRLLLDANGYLQQTLAADLGVAFSADLELSRQRLAAAECNVPGVETSSRYNWVHRVLDGVVAEPDRFLHTSTDRIDHVLTHRVLGLAIFAVVMLIIFQAVFVWARPAMDGIQAVIGIFGGWVESHLADGALRSLLADGVISGAGGVLAFLPQILILYFFIGILEDCGYMARAAFLMDRAMSRIGLSGKSFIPMLSSFACTVPGIMAARVIEDERDRLTTILVSPLLTCSARLPIYALLIAAFIPAQPYFGGLVNLQGLVLAGLYALGIIMAITVAMLLKRTLLRGNPPAFVMELPSYKWPSLKTVAYRVGLRGSVFLRCAGTLIMAVSVLVWAGLYYPHNADDVAPLASQVRALENSLHGADANDAQNAEISSRLAQLHHEIEAVYQHNSLLGRLGHVIEPAVKPLGWDWRIGCAVIASLPAREIVVATMGVMYNLGENADADSEHDYNALQSRLRTVTWEGTDTPVYNIPVALSIMVFFALCIQCAPTLAVMRRETNGWRWPAFAFAYMTVLAYVGALITYQFGMWIGS
jgi:ferrous iron transport protein B